MKIINKNFDELLQEVQQAFANRTIMGVQLPRSGENAISDYFKKLEVKISSDDPVLKRIASTDKKVTAENLQDLLDNIGCRTQDLDNIGCQTQDQAAATELEAKQKIISAYNECVSGKSMTPDEFAIKLFGDTFKRTPEMKTLTRQSQEVFKALHSQYGNNEIKDNLAKVEKNPTAWEKIKDFISKLLIIGLIVGTNAGDKEKYKANKPEAKSLLAHAAKKPVVLSK